VTALLLVVPVVLFVNGVRAAWLFLLATRATPTSPAVHSLVGVATFALAAGLLVWSDVLQRRFAGNPGRLRVRLRASAKL